MTATTKISRPNDLSAFWMPFTANRQFKQTPRMLVSADGMYYKTDDNRDILDGTAGPLVLQCWSQASENCRSGQGTDGRARLCAGLPDGPSQGV